MSDSKVKVFGNVYAKKDADRAEKSQQIAQLYSDLGMVVPQAVTEALEHIVPDEPKFTNGLLDRTTNLTPLIQEIEIDISNCNARTKFIVVRITHG